MALKFQRPSKVHPASPAIQVHAGGPTDNGDESESKKSCRCFCKKKSKRKEEQGEEEEEDDPESQKPKTCKAKLKDKSGGIYLITHQVVCLVLFCSLETRAAFERRAFPDLLIPLVAGLLFFISQVLILVVILMDPGVQPRRSREQQQLEINFYNTHRTGPSPVLRPMLHYGEVILGNYCYECKHFKHPRTHHCSLCDRCIVRYDHHCNILGACVGLRNFPFYFYLMMVVFFYYIYLTSISISILVRKLIEERPTFGQVIQDVSIVWIVIVSLVVIIVCDMGHLILFPCVYIYITALDKTAKELFFVIEAEGHGHGLHHFKCYKVLKTLQEDNNGRSRGCFKILKNLGRYLCSPIPPSLLKDSNYYVVCDLDEVILPDAANCKGKSSMEKWNWRNSSKIQTELILPNLQNEMLELPLPPNKTLCCQL